MVDALLLLLAVLNKQSRQRVLVPGALLSAGPTFASQYSGYDVAQRQCRRVIISFNGVLIGYVVRGAVVDGVGRR